MPDGHASGRGGLRIADEDFGARRKPAVVGCQADVDARYVVAVASSRGGVLVDDSLLEERRVAPVSERDAGVDPCRHGLPQHDQVRVTVIATGFGAQRRRRPRTSLETAPVPGRASDFETSIDTLDVPSFLRDD